MNEIRITIRLTPMSRTTWLMEVVRERQMPSGTIAHDLEHQEAIKWIEGVPQGRGQEEG